MIRVDGASLTIDDVVAVARGGERVVLAPSARTAIERSRRAVDKIVRGGTLAYGIKTGFGQLENVAIPPAQVRELQANLIRSHAAGTGPALSKEQVRATLLIRANALSKGVSGVRTEVVQRLLDCLNAGVHAVVPSKGSLGASGDLAPLAHLALVLIGEGAAEYRGRTLPGSAALKRARLRPLRLESKEGLALINGTSVMAALACLLVHDGRALLKDAQIAASLSFEALRASPLPYDEELARLKPMPGAIAVAANLRRLLRGSEVIPSHRGPHKVQDAYTLRCIPQVLGACGEALDYCARVAEIEVNAATDNPIVLPDGRVLSGGTFHGQSLAMALDFLALAFCVAAGFAERRIARLVDAHLSGLPPFLTERSGLHSGMMVAQYTAAALASESKILAHPASADSLPTSAGQEDWVSMGQTAALKCAQALDNARRTVAIEYLVAAQGIEFVRPLRPGRGPRAAHERIRKTVRKLEEDRPLTPDIDEIFDLMVDGALVAAAERAAGAMKDVSLSDFVGRR
ncbi:MAG TPA: histidine ammonia-lyase [Thermoplasmata archaeon]|nr:histidine ammonia-lyase [Thermoplasmata archaeon]